MRLQESLLLIALFAGSASAQFSARTLPVTTANARRSAEVFVPKFAEFCEKGLSDNKFCKQCNALTTIGAGTDVVVQVGGCGARRLQESNATVAEDEREDRTLVASSLQVVRFTTAAATFFTPTIFLALLTAQKGITVTAGGAQITGASTVTGTLGVTQALTAGNGLTVTAGGAQITGGLQVPTGGVLVAAGGLTVTAGGLAVTAGGLTVTTGGAQITGASTVTGTLGVTDLLTAQKGITVTAGGADINGPVRMSEIVEARFLNGR